MDTFEEIDETIPLDFEEPVEKQRVLSDYNLLELRGEGAQGQVWKAQIKETGQIIALKIVLLNNKNSLENV